MDKRLLCKKCNKEIMDKAQEHGFVCKGDNNDYGKSEFCAYAARDYRGKESGNILWQFFPPEKETKAVRIDCKWTELFGSKIPENYHRKNWEEWKRLVLAAGEKDQVDFWSDTEACQGCRHQDGDWCLRVKLPCTVNPFLTLQHGMGPGMACMGMGRDDLIKQMEFNFTKGEYASGK